MDFKNSLENAVKFIEESISERKCISYSDPFCLNNNFDYVLEVNSATGVVHILDGYLHHFYDENSNPLWASFDYQKDHETNLKVLKEMLTFLDLEAHS